MEDCVTLLYAFKDSITELVQYFLIAHRISINIYEVKIFKYPQ